MSIEQDSLIKVEVTKKDKVRHHILTISDKNIEYLCARYPNNGKLVGLVLKESAKNRKYGKITSDDIESEYDIILNPSSEIPKGIDPRSFKKTYTIPLNVHTIEGTFSKENIRNVISQYKEIPIRFAFSPMIVGYVTLKNNEDK